jgi:hypothetical protein
VCSQKGNQCARQSRVDEDDFWLDCRRNTQATSLTLRNGNNHAFLVQKPRERFRRNPIHNTQEDKWYLPIGGYCRQPIPLLNDCVRCACKLLTN